MADENNYAFIDAQNVYMGTKGDGWSVDLFRLRRYLKERFNVTKALWFVGYLRGQEPFYAILRQAGYIVIFKEIALDRDGAPKGNIDVDLTLHAVDLKDQYDGAVLLTSDGDFASLVRYLRERNKLRVVLSPTRRYTSKLLRRAADGSRSLQYLEDARKKIGRRPRPEKS